MPLAPPVKTEQTGSVPSPATQPSWRFGGLTAAELIPCLQHYLYAQNSDANWQLVWLNNDGRPVIGVLPKVSWSVYPLSNDAANSDKQAAYQIIKNCRDGLDSHAKTNQAITSAYMSYSDWQEDLIAYSQAYDIDDTCDNNCSSTTEIEQQPSYQHGLIGFIGYDIAAYVLSPNARIELAAQPCATLGHYDIYLTPNAEQASWQLTIKDSVTDTDNEHKGVLVKTLISYLDILDKELSNQALAKLALETSYKTTPLLLKAQWSKRDYQQAFDKTQSYLQQGDCYQINLTQAWQGAFNQSPHGNVTPMLIDYLPALHHNTQAPFAGYLAVNHIDSEISVDTQDYQFELLSCSPELFFTFDKDDNSGKHHIRTKPIKGTMPRGLNTAQDNAYKQQLIDSEKDRAENVMIVDLLRNDLGKYAKFGSVKVPQLFAIESFSNVHHMVSTITAELKTDSHPLKVLFGSLPAGSITGTPKKRAVEIISELEGAARGAYCGTLGYMNFDGSGQWNVLIRTLQANTLSNDELEQERHVTLWAGGGITVASDCNAEYQECLDKVGNLLGVLAQNNIKQ
ncbi:MULTISPECIES: anthranilate synthase component I family protein [Psychrobacter]|uniref:anthranilate synthase component I family protein n=1 Tax=Psychrobacter TaxID=497 RepID=UPI0007F3334E|nr:MULTISPECIES: anthranilate synthase component I family protein [Psychrobacter]OAP71202.1 anthranilate synthase [Psychrobacter sp. SHUES1]